MFVKSIDRNIKGVIKVGQDEDQHIFEELDEYVVTNQLSKHFREFFQVYQPNSREQIDDMGVWISGFFGSGKSHFLKILSYLLENKTVNDRPAVSFFEDKIEDPMVIANMEAASSIPCDVILFNIDSKSAHDLKGDKEAIVKVFAKVFYDHQGFYGDMPWVAAMESALTDEGLYEKFKQTIKDKTGEEWEKRRQLILFDQDLVVETLHEVRGMSREAASTWFTAKDANLVLSIENFAKIVNHYLDKQPENYRLVFLVDEMGQYIGNNFDMMTNLQTVVENLGTHCRGKVWVLVTSQEELASIVKGVNRDLEDNFSRIQDRFKTRLNLTSANVDEVIKRRLLEKTDTATETLSVYYNNKSAVLRNLISFAAGTPNMPNYADEVEFAEVYPFIPYQFNLLQKVFSGIREHASSGSHMASGERSLLSAFQEAGQFYGDHELGTLVPFHNFYDSVSSFLVSSISQVIEQASSNSKLEAQDIDVLKILFMIKYVKEMPATLDNITTLMVSHVDQDKLKLKEEVLASLRRLSEQTLIQQNGDNYIFLTNEEQEINKEIQRMQIEDSEICAAIGKIIFEEIYEQPSYRYSNQYNFSYNQMIDDRPRGVQASEITLQIITAKYRGNLDEQSLRSESSLRPNTVLYVLPENQPFLEEIEIALKIEAFRLRNSSFRNTTSSKEIIEAKAGERQERLRRAESLLTVAMGEAQVYVQGDKLDTNTRNPKEKIDQGLKRIVEIIYSKLGHIKEYVRSDAELRQVLMDKENEALGLEDLNKDALDEVRLYVERRSLLNENMSMKTMRDQFQKAPFGWHEYDIAALIAKLTSNQELRLQYGGANLSINDPKLVDYLTKRTEIERLVIRKRESIDQDLLSRIRQLAHTVFNHSSLPDDEDGLAKRMIDILEAYAQRTERLLDRYQEKNGSKYPDKDVVNNAQNLLQTMLQYSEPSQLFQVLDENSDNLQVAIEDLMLVEEFFDGQQKGLFDDVIFILDLFEDNKQHVYDTEILSLIEQLEEIINTEQPYSLIHKIPGLRDQFKKQFTNLLTEACKPIQERIEQDYELVQEELGKYEFGEPFIRREKQPFENLLEQIGVVNDFNKAYSMETTSRNYRQQAFRRIETEQQRLEQEKVEQKGGGGVVIPPKPIARKQIESRDLFDSRIVLRNQDDIQAFLEKLRTKLENNLTDDNEIEIIW